MKKRIPSRIGAPLSGEPHPGLQWIEVASFLQIPGFQIIGLPAPEVAEARERVRAAIAASGLEFSRRRVILNLSPASIKKRGTGADLAMALAVLRESYGADEEIPGLGPSVIAWGELGLDGRVKPAGQITFAVYAAWQAGADFLLVADDEYILAREKLATLRLSGLIQKLEPPRVLAVRNLNDAWKLFEHLEDAIPIPINSTDLLLHELKNEVALAQLMPIPSSLERTLGVAATGNHHLLLLGPRGTGKSHALDWLTALRPEPTAEIRIQRALIEELGGIQANGSSVRRISSHVRPSALIGSAAPWGVRPGEFSLAHGGILLADEFPEWARDAREALREPLERGKITLTRARHSVELPARFTLAANGNLCPCGGWPPHLPLPIENSDRNITRCICSIRARDQYLSRLSGPLLDRLDIMVMTAHAEPISDVIAAQRLELLREQVRKARERATRTWGQSPAHLSGAQLEELLAAHPEWAEALSPSRFASLRQRHKVLRVALTLAAWDGLPGPSRASFAEAACYRPERFGLNA